MLSTLLQCCRRRFSGCMGSCWQQSRTTTLLTRPLLPLWLCGHSWLRAGSHGAPSATSGSDFSPVSQSIEQQRIASVCYAHVKVNMSLAVSGDPSPQGASEIHHRVGVRLRAWCEASKHPRLRTVLDVRSNAHGFSSEAADIGEQLLRPSTTLDCKVQGSVKAIYPMICKFQRALTADG